MYWKKISNDKAPLINIASGSNGVLWGILSVNSQKIIARKSSLVATAGETSWDIVPQLPEQEDSSYNTPISIDCAFDGTTIALGSDSFLYRYSNNLSEWIKLNGTGPVSSFSVGSNNLIYYVSKDSNNLYRYLDKGIIQYLNRTSISYLNVTPDDSWIFYIDSNTSNLKRMVADNINDPSADTTVDEAKIKIASSNDASRLMYITEENEVRVYIGEKQYWASPNKEMYYDETSHTYKFRDLEGTVLSMNTGPKGPCYISVDNNGTIDCYEMIPDEQVAPPTDKVS